MLSKNSKAREDIEEVTPAADSSNGIPPPHTLIRRQAHRSFIRRRTSGNKRRHLVPRPGTFALL